MRHRRRVLSAVRQTANAASVRKLILHSGLINRCTRIALYSACDGELDMTKLAEQLLLMGKRVSLTIIKSSTKIEFRALTAETQLVCNRFGIPEPDPDNSTLDPLWTMSVIFMPLVAFDAKGNRLGMGGGYYDRSLSKLQRRPLCVGVGHELQYHPNISPMAWDEKMDAVITENKVRVFSKRASVALNTRKTTSGR